MIKALFLDIDGTLVSFKTHCIPESTVEALTLARQRGVKIIISTGRPPHIITNLTQITHLIDGFVSTNGALCYIGDKVIRMCEIMKEDVEVIISRCQELSAPVIIVTRDNMSVLGRGEAFDRLFVQLLNIHNITDNPFIVREMLRQPVIQLTPFINADDEQEIISRTHHCTSGRWHSEFTDITSLDADKGKGLAVMAEALGISTAETMAFGDGGNDIPIIREAGIGIAMGNAGEEIKVSADYVTTSVDDDGIMHALKHFEVI